METQVRELTGRPVRIAEVDLLLLTDADRDAVFDAFATGADFPLVVFDGSVVCAGPLDAGAIAGAVRGSGG